MDKLEEQAMVEFHGLLMGLNTKQLMVWIAMEKMIESIGNYPSLTFQQGVNRIKGFKSETNSKP